MNLNKREWQRKTDNVKRVTLPDGTERGMPEHVTDYIGLQKTASKEFDVTVLSNPFPRHYLIKNKKRTIWTDKLSDNGRGM